MASGVYLYTGEGGVRRDAVRIEVDRSVTEIPDRSFQNCDRMESLLLHEGLLKIGRGAFKGCSSLRSVRCPSTVAEIGAGAFARCSSLATVELPEGFKSIEAWTFARCTSLEGIRISNSVAQIGIAAFLGCTNLSLAYLPEDLRTIGNVAFKDCRSLGGLRVPSSVVQIGERAFDGCSSLSSVQLHEDLQMMKRFAFRGCPSESVWFVRLSERMEAIIMDDRTTSMFDSRLSEITLEITRANHDDHEATAVWEKCKKGLERAHEVLTYLELKGAGPVLELSLWKGKIEGEEWLQGYLANDKDRGQDARERKRLKVMKYADQDLRLSRTDCRVKCGAGIVLAEVRKFFAYSLSWPPLDD